MTRTPIPFRPLRAALQLAALAAAAAMAATTWAASLPADEGYMLDAVLWRSEVAGSSNGHWPTDGWSRLALGDKAIDVRPADARKPAVDGDDAWYVRLPNTKFKTGARKLYRMTPAVAQPTLGREYQLTMGRTPFGFTVDAVEGALTYTIRYAGAEHVYRVALAGTPTAIRAIADLDGDAQPDFVIDVDGQVFLLLSTAA